MDIRLPGISSIEAAIKIRQLASPQKDNPIIAITAFSDRKTHHACLDAGINVVETKPVKLERLAELVGCFCQETVATVHT